MSEGLQVENQGVQVTPEDVQSKALDNLAELESELGEDNKAIVAGLKQDEQQQAAESMEDIAARQGAAWAVGAVETVLKMRFPGVQVEKEKKDLIVEKGAAVAKKYGVGLPGWLEPWKEEIELGMVLGSAGVSVYLQVQGVEEGTEGEAGGSEKKGGFGQLLRSLFGAGQKEKGVAGGAEAHTA